MANNNTPVKTDKKEEIKKDNQKAEAKTEAKAEKAADAEEIDSEELFKRRVSIDMAHTAKRALNSAMKLVGNYDVSSFGAIEAMEDQVDGYEDLLGGYLVKLSAHELTDGDSREASTLLHLIGDFERISDHAVNIAEAAQELGEKKLTFSEAASREIGVLFAAVGEAVDLAMTAFENGDVDLARRVEPLEQVVDDLGDQIKLSHIQRLQSGDCTIELGFVLSDLLINFERVSDHCSNIGSCIIEISQYGAMDMHKYLADLKKGGGEFERKYQQYKAQYRI